MSHHAAFRVGGWAFVRRDGEAIAGQAGGARRASAERTALAAVVAALSQAPSPDQSVQIATSSREIAALPARIAAAQAGEDAPNDNLDLWAQAMRALAGGRVTIRSATASGRPTAFAAAWAEQARDRAKDKGDFAAAIPKPNLAKSGAA
jgi:hypothetical protein